MSESTRSAAAEFADVLVSGLTGRQLYSYICERFPTISRFDCFLGIALASALWEADLVIAEGEVEAAKARSAHE